MGHTSADAGQSFSFTNEERKQLFDIVRKTVRSKLYENKKYVIDEEYSFREAEKANGCLRDIKD